MRLFLIVLLVVSQSFAGPLLATPRPPRRIISLAPGTTEILFALGAGKSVVGDTTYCNYPPAALKITKIGDVSVNYEKVLSLHPDLIIASDANMSAVKRLRQMHLPVLLISPTSFVATEQSIWRVGDAIGRPIQAGKIVAHMEAARRTAAHLTAQDKHHPAVLFVLGMNPLYTAGSGTFMNNLVTIAGGINSASTIRNYAVYSREQVLIHPPDFIIADTALLPAMQADPVFRTLTAVKAGRFIQISPDILSRPGPRLADALLTLATALHAKP